MNLIEKIFASHAGLKEVSPGQIITAKVDVALLFGEHRLDGSVQRRVGPAQELVELVLSHSIDHEPEDREALPVRDGGTEGLHVALLVRPAQYVGHVLADVPSDTRHLAEMVDFLGGGPGHHDLQPARGRRRQAVLDVQVGTTNFTIALDRQHATEEVLVFGILPVEVFQLDLFFEHLSTSAFFGT
jgi:hypothetical protein